MSVLCEIFCCVQRSHRASNKSAFSTCKDGACRADNDNISPRNRIGSVALVFYSLKCNFIIDIDSHLTGVIERRLGDKQRLSRLMLKYTLLLPGNVLDVGIDTLKATPLQLISESYRDAFYCSSSLSLVFKVPYDNPDNMGELMEVNSFGVSLNDKLFRTIVCDHDSSFFLDKSESICQQFLQIVESTLNI
jgi:hypothetical protein